MTTITLQRHKCIGCSYCVDLAPKRWAMSKKDGKSVLIGSTQKNKFWTLKVSEEEEEISRRAAALCPVKIISVL